MSLLRLDDVSVSIQGMPVLDRVSLTLSKGHRLGLVGESGAGKSILARAIAGLLPEGATMNGTLSLDGAAASGNDALRSGRFAFVPAPSGTPLDPMRLVGAQMGRAGTADAASQLALVGLDPSAPARLPSDLTAGDRRRVTIARALAGKPDLLICDDPTAGLDLVDRRRVLDLIDSFCTSQGCALLLISHDLKAVAAYCTRIAVMQRGRLVETGDKADVLGHPKHDLTRAMLMAGRHRARTLMRAPIGDDVLDIRSVSRRYRRPDVSIFEPRRPLMALDDVSLTIRAGESLGLVGPAWAGKTTLARIIAGLDRSSAGELEFDRQVYHGSDLPAAARAAVSLVLASASRSFDPRLSIGESVAQPLHADHSAELDELGQRIVEMVRAVGLSADMLNLRPHEVSPGQLQRFAIARALVARPRLIILDEPAAALDVLQRGELLVMLNRLRADFGLTFLVISQDLDTIRVVADRVAVMDKGKIVESGTPAMLLERPQQPVTRAMVAAALPEIGIVPVF